jgi:hypothetical protein
MARLVLLVCAACGGAPAGPTTPAAPRPLTPADVGFPEVPPEEPRAAPREAPTRASAPSDPPAYYRRESCPPVAGCQLTREITDDGVRTLYSCSRGSGIRGGRALRTLRITDLELEGGLDRAAVRRAFVRKIDDWKGCLARTGTSAQIQLRGTIAASGAPVTADVTGADEPGAACLRDVTSASELPGASAPTLYELTLDYDVTSPASVPPLQCR